MFLLLSLFCPGPSAFKLTILNQRLQLYKFPSNMLKKMPQDITESLKAVDYENIILYGVFAFKDLIDDKHYDILLSLSFFLSKLCNKIVKRNEIPMLEELGKNIVSKIADLPDKLHLSNMHSILHLCQTVLDYGPLICQSSFQLEDLIGKSVRTIKTGHKVPEQLMNKLMTKLSINAILNQQKNIPIVREFLTELNLMDKKRSQQYCAESSSMNKTTNDHFAILKDGRFVTIITGDRSSSFKAMEIRTEPLKLDDEKIFDYIFLGELDQTKVITFSIDDIDRPFAAIKESATKYTILDIINRHI